MADRRSRAAPGQLEHTSVPHDQRHQRSSGRRLGGSPLRPATLASTLNPLTRHNPPPSASLSATRTRRAIRQASRGRGSQRPASPSASATCGTAAAGSGSRQHELLRQTVRHLDGRPARRSVLGLFARDAARRCAAAFQIGHRQPIDPAVRHPGHTQQFFRSCVVEKSCLLADQRVAAVWASAVARARDEKLQKTSSP